MIVVLTLSGDHFGCAALTSAPTPAGVGVAIDVPDSTRTSFPLPAPAEARLSPGAVTSGLTTPSEPWVPRELNPERVSFSSGLYVGTEVASAPSKVTLSVPAVAAGAS